MRSPSSPARSPGRPATSLPMLNAHDAHLLSQEARIVAGGGPWFVEAFFQLSSFLRKLHQNDTLDASRESIAHPREPVSR
jgi:hypothetical protein